MKTKDVVTTTNIIVIVLMVFMIGVAVGMNRYQHLHKEFEIVQTHMIMQREKDFQYCPYCGEKLIEGSDAE